MAYDPTLPMCDSPQRAVEMMLARLARPRWEGVAEEVPLAGSLGRVLAREVRADRDSPAFDHSSMDGYAVRARDLRLLGDGGGATLRLVVAGESRIGAAPPSMPEGAVAMRIATGAPIPAGPSPADVILRREDVLEIRAEGCGGGEIPAVSAIEVGRGAVVGVHPGLNIRRRGENQRAGETACAAGEVVTSAMVGALASVGCVRPLVRARVRVAIITTGDEVVPADRVPGEFEIRNANGAALHAALTGHRWLEVGSLVHVRDDPGALRASVRAAIGGADAVVLSGGVSAGHRDPVREAVEHAGAAIVFHGVAQRPGKPMLGGVAESERARGGRQGGLEAGSPASIPVFGLPGNPVSTLVTCTRVVLPVLAGLAGIGRWHPGTAVRVETTDTRSIDLWWHRPVRLTGDGRAVIVESRGSGDNVSSAQADGFVELPPGWRSSGAGSNPVAFYSWWA